MPVPVVENFMIYENKHEGNTTIAVEEYAYLVKRIAHRMMVRMPSVVQVEDLIQSGMIGLIEASQKYDAGKGASFETYAGIRIRGAMVDEMRRGDWAPRSVHRNSRRIAEAIGHIEGRTGRDAKDSEIAAELDISLAEYHDMAKDSACTRLFSWEDTHEHDGDSPTDIRVVESTGPAEKNHKQALRQALVDAIKKLPEREQMVLSLYYEQEMNLKEIGQVLGVSESRVSQIHSQAAVRLRTKLSAWQA